MTPGPPGPGGRDPLPAAFGLAARLTAEQPHRVLADVASADAAWRCGDWVLLGTLDRGHELVAEGADPFGRPALGLTVDLSAVGPGRGPDEDPSWRALTAPAAGVAPPSRHPAVDVDALAGERAVVLARGVRSFTRELLTMLCDEPATEHRIAGWSLVEVSAGDALAAAYALHRRRRPALLLVCGPWTARAVTGRAVRGAVLQHVWADGEVRRRPGIEDDVADLETTLWLPHVDAAAWVAALGGDPAAARLDYVRADLRRAPRAAGEAAELLVAALGHAVPGGVADAAGAVLRGEPPPPWAEATSQVLRPSPRRAGMLLGDPFSRFNRVMWWANLVAVPVLAAGSAVNVAAALRGTADPVEVILGVVGGLAAAASAFVVLKISRERRRTRSA